MDQGTGGKRSFDDGGLCRTVRGLGIDGEIGADRRRQHFDLGDRFVDGLVTQFKGLQRRNRRQRRQKDAEHHRDRPAHPGLDARDPLIGG